jgi:hypothetical protein
MEALVRLPAVRSQHRASGGVRHTLRAKNRTPVQAVVDGDGYDGGLLLFVHDGQLSALEYWWVIEEMPDVFPPLSATGKPIIASP